MQRIEAERAIAEATAKQLDLEAHARRQDVEAQARQAAQHAREENRPGPKRTEEEGARLRERRECEQQAKAQREARRLTAAERELALQREAQAAQQLLAEQQLEGQASPRARQAAEARPKRRHGCWRSSAPTKNGGRAKPRWRPRSMHDRLLLKQSGSGRPRRKQHGAAPGSWPGNRSRMNWPGAASMHWPGRGRTIERNAALVRTHLSGDLTRSSPLVSVAARSGSSIDDVTIVRKSGHRSTDDAVRRIMRLNARYAAFPRT